MMEKKLDQPFVIRNQSKIRTLSDYNSFIIIGKILDKVTNKPVNGWTLELKVPHSLPIIGQIPISGFREQVDKELKVYVPKGGELQVPMKVKAPEGTDLRDYVAVLEVYVCLSENRMGRKISLQPHPQEFNLLPKGKVSDPGEIRSLRSSIDGLMALHNSQIFKADESKNWRQRRDYVQSLISDPKVSRLCELQKVHEEMSGIIKGVLAPALSPDEVTKIQDSLSQAYRKLLGDKDGAGIIDKSGVLTNKARLFVVMDLLTAVGRPDLATNSERLGEVIQFFIQNKSESFLLVLTHPLTLKRKKITKFNYNLFDPESEVVDIDGRIMKLKDRKRHYEVQDRFVNKVVLPIYQYLSISLSIIQRAEQVLKSKGKSAA